MTRNQRRAYTLLFVLAFAITAPTLIFMAKGYSFDTIGKVFVHNGAITIKSIPKDAIFYIDGKKVSNRMLNIINNYYVINGVRFGKHIVECKKEGYTTWKKEVEVHSGISTEFWNIILFPKKNDTLKTYSARNVAKFFLSPRENDELVLYRKNGNQKIVSILNAKNDKEEVLYMTEDYDNLLPLNDENIEWSSNHKKILIPAKEKNIKDYIIIDVKNNEQEKISLAKFLATTDFSDLIIPSTDKSTEKSSLAASPNQATKLTTEISTTGTKSLPESSRTVNAAKAKVATEKEVAENGKEKAEKNLGAITEIKDYSMIHQTRWMFDSDHQLLLLTTDHKLFFIDIADASKSRLLAVEVNGFDLAGDHVYYAKLGSSLIWDIKPYKPNYKQPISTVSLDVPIDSFVKLIAYDELRIALITADKKLYVLNNDKPSNEITFTALEDGVMNVQFSDDGKKMLYWADNSLWAYMLREWENQPKRKRGEKVFITNFSSGVKNVQWMETFENVIFTNGKTVKSAELDNRDQINLADILEVNTSPKDNVYIYNKHTSTLFFLDTLTTNNSKQKLQSVELIEHNGLFGF